MNEFIEIIERFRKWHFQLRRSILRTQGLVLQFGERIENMEARMTKLENDRIK